MQSKDGELVMKRYTYEFHSTNGHACLWTETGAKVGGYIIIKYLLKELEAGSTCRAPFNVAF